MGKAVLALQAGPWNGEGSGAGQGERKRGPSGQNERSFFFLFCFLYFKALFKLISKAFEFVLNFDQNHTSQ